MLDLFTTFDEGRLTDTNEKLLILLTVSLFVQVILSKMLLDTLDKSNCYGKKQKTEFYSKLDRCLNQS